MLSSPLAPGNPARPGKRPWAAQQRSGAGPLSAALLSRRPAHRLAVSVAAKASIAPAVAPAAAPLAVASVAHAAAAAPPVFDAPSSCFLMVATMLVAAMNLPGLCLFYGGMMDSGNTVNLFATLFAVACAGTLFWFGLGYTLAFGGGGNAFIGGLDRLCLRGLTVAGPLTAAGIPEALYATFHATYATITPCLVVGAYAGRVRFAASVLFCVAWMLVVYCPFAHMVWGGGFLEQAGLIDFAGGVVIHVTAGASALAAAQFVGPRRSVAAAAPLAAGSPSSHHAEHQPPNLVSIMIGTGLVWATWLAFNGGSVAAGVSASAAWVFINTQAAAAAGGLTWTLLDALAPGGRGRPSALGACLGVVAGLVCITPAAVFVAPWAAVLMGAAGATACRAAVAALRAASAAGRVPDDACEVFAVHGTGGLVGNSLTALFAAQQLGGTVVVPNLAAQFALHAAVSGAAVAWAYGATWAVLAALDAVLPGGVRVPAADEDAGLDASLHGETAAQQPPPAPAAAPAAVAGNGNGAAAPAGLKQPLAV